MIFMTCFLPLLLGCFCLALAMPKHHRQWLKHPHTKKRARIFTLFGWTLLTMGLIVCMAQMPLGLAVTFFFAVLTVAIIVTALASTFWAEKQKVKR